jgi:hypothetical protein
MIPAQCVNDAKKPQEIPTSHWVKKKTEYTIIAVYNRVQPGAMLGFILQEIDLEELDGPYSCFMAKRFAVAESDIPELLELIKACEELQDFDPIELIEKEILIDGDLV